MKVTAGALIFSGNNLLILKPTYRDYWILPGGHVESGESPREACIREIEEEIGFGLHVTRLLCVDFWRKGTRIGTGQRAYEEPEDKLVFLFQGGLLTPEQIDRIKVPPEEIEGFKFLSLEEALLLLAPYYENRLRLSMDAIETGQIEYLEGGRRVD